MPRGCVKNTAPSAMSKADLTTNSLTPRQLHTLHPSCTAETFSHKQDFRSKLRERRDHVTKGRGTGRLVAGCRLVLPLHKGCQTPSPGHLMELLHLGLSFSLIKDSQVCPALCITPPSLTPCPHQDLHQHKMCCCMNPLLLQSCLLLLHHNHTPTSAQGETSLL